MLLHIILGFSLALWGPSAVCHGACYSGQTANPQDIPQDLMITLGRSVCYGTCPEYKLTIAADGAVVFEGGRFVKWEGKTIKSAISHNQLGQLMAEFDKVNFFSLEDDYTGNSRLCDEYIADGPSASISIRINGKSKTIRRNDGCLGAKAPNKELTELENKIDGIVNTAQWLPDNKGR
jgi:hypothetical protein